MVRALFGPGNDEFVCASMHASLVVGFTIYAKIIITLFQFKYVIVIMLVHMFVSVVVLEGGRLLDILKMPKYSLEKGSIMFLPSVFSCLHYYFSLKSLDGMNIVMHCALMRCRPLFNVYFGVFILGNRFPSFKIAASVFVLVLATITAGFTDRNWHSVSYIYAGLAVVFQEAYLALIHLIPARRLTGIQMVYRNAYNSFIVFFVFDILHEELCDAYIFVVRAVDLQFCMIFTLLVILGVFLHGSELFAYSTSETGVRSRILIVRAVVETLIGFILGLYAFMDMYIDVYNIISVFINVIAFAFYAHFKHQKKAKIEGETTGIHDKLKKLSVIY